MKNLIEYYYGLNAFRLRQINGGYVFFCKNNTYYFCKVTDLIHFFQKMNVTFLDYNNPYVHTLIRNCENKPLTFNGTDYYALFKINLRCNKQIDINDIKMFDKITSDFGIIKKIEIPNWSNMWIKKIDYLEHYVDMRDDWSDDLKCLFYYYIGIAENSIEYLKISKDVINKKDKLNGISLSHERVNCFDTLYDFYNPINFVIDKKTRDVAEYLKSLFFNKKVDTTYIKNIITSVNYSRVEYIQLVSRVMFPTFFFDSFEQLALSEISNVQILQMYDSTIDYEMFIDFVISVINKTKKVDIPAVKWMIRN